MNKAKAADVSQQTKEQATALAKANQRPGQTKAQTKLVEEGIRKGIDQYKKQQKALARERNKQRKKVTNSEPQLQNASRVDSVHEDHHFSVSAWLGWGLLIVSWIGFISYWIWQRG
ncbi:DUF2956 domain-containing protein [Celerinatantimonas sp. YJH-8]|uniref:DUF2956 domain-containing protein n=1 Tax=Celerinatantimonas sp. YJH-8 TaxID=3228714 RepID=UPI0038C8A176